MKAKAVICGCFPIFKKAGFSHDEVVHFGVDHFVFNIGWYHTVYFKEIQAYDYLKLFYSDIKFRTKY